MNRREFLQSAAAGAAGVGLAGCQSLSTSAGGANASAALSGKPVLMNVGHQHDHSEPTLRRLAAFGVTHICSALPSRTFDDNWSVDGLTRLRKQVESFGIALDCVPLPMSANSIRTAEYPEIMLAKDPQRDQAIDNICQMIRNTGKAGIPMAKYNMTFLGMVRTGSTRGRGGANDSTFVYDQLNPDQPLTEAGVVTEEIYWDRITYFLKKVVPVAHESKVKIALHPQDPAMPPGKGYQGVQTVLGTVDGLKRFIDIESSPYHGLNFCQGTVSEMLAKPNDEICDVIRYFGSRGKIFNVHFRNIKGGYLNFRETFPDEGDVDMPKALRAYQEVGFDGMIMPDHVPVITADGGNQQAFAFCFGYIQALLQVMRAESKGAQA